MKELKALLRLWWPKSNGDIDEDGLSAIKITLSVVVISAIIYLMVNFK
jgi:hypothetical protein